MLLQDHADVHVAPRPCGCSCCSKTMRMFMLLQACPAQAQTMRKKLWRVVVHRRLQQSAESFSCSSNAGGMSSNAQGSVGGNMGRKGGWEAGKGAKGGSDGESSDASTTSDSSGEEWCTGRLEEAGLGAGGPLGVLSQ